MNKKTSNDDNGRAWLVLHVCVRGDKENCCFVLDQDSVDLLLKRNVRY